MTFPHPLEPRERKVGKWSANMVFDQEPPLVNKVLPSADQRLSRARLMVGRGVADPRLVVRAGFIQDVSPKQLQGNSIDLKVKDVFRIDGGISLYRSGKRELPEYVIQNYNPVDFMYKLDPQHLYQIEFEETVALPWYLCGITLIRSSMAKSGCSGESGLYDSGYAGSTGMSVSVKFAS